MASVAEQQAKQSQTVHQKLKPEHLADFDDLPAKTAQERKFSFCLFE